MTDPADNISPPMAEAAFSRPGEPVENVQGTPAPGAPGERGGRNGAGYPIERAGSPLDGARHGPAAPPLPLDLPEEETVDGLPVLAEVRALPVVAPRSLPAIQAAAAAATGFVAGAATIAIVKRRGARKVARVNRTPARRATEMLPIVGTRTFLIDVHLVAKPE